MKTLLHQVLFFQVNYKIFYQHSLLPILTHPHTALHCQESFGTVPQHCQWHTHHSHILINPNKQVYQFYYKTKESWEKNRGGPLCWHLEHKNHMSRKKKEGERDDTSELNESISFRVFYFLTCATTRRTCVCDISIALMVKEAILMYNNLHIRQFFS